MKLKKLQHGDKVEFDPFDSAAPTPGASLGRAEFIFCPVWKRKRLRLLYIYPMQQRDQKWRWVVEANALDLSIQSWTHKGVKKPEPWLHYWCEEHKGMSFRVYVPENSKNFSVHVGSNLSINFGFD